MRENTLLKIALASAVVGLIALFLISKSIDIPEYNPSEIKDLGKDVKLTGMITKVRDADGLFFIEIKQENYVTVVFFTKEENEFKKGENVEIIGKVQEYNGKPEIIAKKIRVID